jgi:hypothetical protein
VREGRTVSTAPAKSPQATPGANSIGTAGAVAAVLKPDRGSDEAQHDLGGLDHPEVGGGSAPAAPPTRRIHWLS